RPVSIAELGLVKSDGRAALHVGVMNAVPLVVIDRGGEAGRNDAVDNLVRPGAGKRPIAAVRQIPRILDLPSARVVAGFVARVLVLGVVGCAIGPRIVPARLA